jgi:predicted metal-binding membrane protein
MPAATLKARPSREQVITLAGLAGVTVLAWLYLFYDASRMASMPMDASGMAGMNIPPRGKLLDPVSIGLTFVMWSIMMVAMMLPSASPAILMYSTLARKRKEAGTAIAPAWQFTLGYLAVWAAYSAVATVLQLGLQEAALLTEMMVSKSAWLSGFLFVIAGIYQWLPIKDACLQKCRAPLQFFMFHWRPGKAGAFWMGTIHGAFCLGCCWALMLLLFVAGVMNLVWVALLAVFVLIEKLAPNGAVAGRLSGLAMIALGGGLLSGIWAP